MKSGESNITDRSVIQFVDTFSELKESLKIVYELGKVRISLPIALSALTGYTLFNGYLDIQGWFMAIGVFLMSCSSSAFNHWQERNIDAQMPRTKNRPIPSGKISANGALAVAIGFSASGTLLLLFTNPLMALL